MSASAENELAPHENQLYSLEIDVEVSSKAAIPPEL